MNAASAPEFDIVIPTVGRESLARLLGDLAVSVTSTGVSPRRIIVVDDRPNGDSAAIASPAAIADRTAVVSSGGLGPAHARNRGLRCVKAPWVAFLDDDVRLPDSWLQDLVDDLRACAPGDAATQGRLSVPLPGDRRPSDWERNVHGLAGAPYITADMAVRTAVLRSCGGFDERFRRAYREDVELAIRLLRAGHRIVWGARQVEHPVRHAPWWVSVAKQAGNADDALLAQLHGKDWRDVVDAPRGDRSMHVVTTALGLGALVTGVAGDRRASSVLTMAYLGAVGRLALRRVAPGPRTGREVAAMGATSAVLPFAATFHWIAGRIRWRHAVPKTMPVAPAVVVRARELELAS